MEMKPRVISGQKNILMVPLSGTAVLRGGPLSFKKPLSLAESLGAPTRKKLFKHIF